MSSTANSFMGSSHYSNPNAFGSSAPRLRPQSAPVYTKYKRKKRVVPKNSVRSDVTKNGVVRNPSAGFPTEERFAWQKPNVASEAFYDINSSFGKQPSSMNRNTGNTKFGTSTREDWGRMSAVQTNENTGPSSYKVKGSVGKQALSDKKSAGYVNFSVAQRHVNFAMKHYSPGPVYKLPRTLGKDRAPMFSFGSSDRPPLSGTIYSPGPVYTLRGTVGGGKSYTFGGSRRSKRM